MSGIIINIGEIKKILNESTQQSQLVLWHGGDLGNSLDDTMSHKKGRWEYGPGLYLTTHYDTAAKYAKGSRKLYRITIANGNDINDTPILASNIYKFVREYVISTKRIDILERIAKYETNGMVPGYIFLNIIINESAIPNTKSRELRTFILNNGVDYVIVDNAFGWGERMVVLFNFNKIIKKEIIKPKDKIDNYSLPTEFSDLNEENVLMEYIRKRDGKWVVVSRKNKVLGTHDTKEDALAQLRAIEAHKHMHETDTLDEDKIAQFDAYDQRTKIGVYKNPVNLDMFPPDVRGAIDNKGNIYIVNKTHGVIHASLYTELVKFLPEVAATQTNRWWKLMPQDVNILMIIRSDFSNTFYLADSYDEILLYDDDFTAQAQEFMKLAKQVNPQYTFLLT